MASEYLLKKAREEAVPPPPPRVYTKKEKALNWLHYNKLWLCIGAVLLWIVGSMLWTVLGIGQIPSDLTVAYVGSREFSEEAVQQLEAALAALAEDQNGDGVVKVTLKKYRLNQGGDMETALYFNYAADAVLLADMTAGDSAFFLTEDPQSIQRSYQIFSRDDGTPPDDRDYEAMDKVYLWENCPALAALDVGSADVSGLYIGRRAFFDEKQAARNAGCEAVWNTIIQGAQR